MAWYLFGAQAVVVWGRPRLSADLDVTAKLPLAEMQDFLEAMAEAGFALETGDPEEHVAETRVLPFLHTPTGVPLDLVVAGPGLEDEFLERAVDRDFAGLTVPVISPEDLVAAKILASREKDLEDVRGILLERWPLLDLDLVRQTLSTLEAALARSDLIPVFDRELARAQKRAPRQAGR